MEDEKAKEREESSSPHASSQATGTVESTSRPPSSTSLESQDSLSSQPVRKSVRKRVPPPSPLSPSPPRKRTKRKGHPKQGAHHSPVEPEEEYYSDSSSIMSEDLPYLPYQNERAGIYAPLLRLRQQRQNDCIPVVRLPPRTIGGVRDQLEKTKVCNCKRSNCLKLYCDCFMAGLYCTAGCNCVTCKNNQDHPRERNMAIDVTLMRNANAFRPQLHTMQSSSPTKTMSGKTIESPSVTTRDKGCNCRKSFCLKKVSTRLLLRFAS